MGKLADILEVIKKVESNELKKSKESNELKELKESKKITKEEVTFFEMLTPSFIGGIIIGIILGIPGVNLIFPLVSIGGYIAVKLIKNFYQVNITDIDSIKIGAFSGFIGAFIGVLITMIIAVYFSQEIFELANKVFDPKMAELILYLSGLDPYISLLSLRTRFILNIIFGIFFGVVGGYSYLYGHGIIEKRLNIIKPR